MISLSVSKNYQEELWCDVIPMDACHILLWRSWMFNRRVIHDGYLNTYSFSKDGKKITLAPLSHSSSTKINHKRNQNKLTYSSLVANHYLRLLTISLRPLRSRYLLPLMNQKTYPQVTPLPYPCLSSLAMSFLMRNQLVYLPKDPYNTTLTLDLEPYFQTKPAYRMNSKKTLEIQRHVDELITKRLIRESLSPYFIPVVLVPEKDGSMRMCVDS